MTLGPLVAVVAALSFQAPAVAESTSSVFFTIDPTAEAMYGQFPSSRRIYADAVKRAHDAGAKAVALKFFFDRPSNAVDDQAMAQSLTLMPVLLQARIVSDSLAGDELASLPKMTLAGVRPPPDGLRSSRGDFPIDPFAAGAAEVGFVDTIAGDHFDSIELQAGYRGMAVKSLWLEIIELEFGAAAIQPDGALTVGSARLEMDATGRVRCQLSSVPPVEVLPLSSLLRGDTPASALQEKVVIIGYLGPKMPTASTAPGEMKKLHEIFFEQLACIESAAQKR